MAKEINITRRSASKYLVLGASSLLLNPLLSFKSKPKMNQRIIPSTNEKIPCVGLGTWQTFDVGDSEQEREPLKQVLKILVENGGSVIDSSPMYGRSEKVVGELTTELGIKDKIFEATKVWTSGASEGRKQINNSIRLMKADPLDLLQVHNLVDWKIQLGTLKDLKNKNLIRYIGVTHYHEGGYAEMERIIKTEPIDFIQINYNLAVRDAEKKILPMAKDNGIAVITNRPYEGGSLFRKFRGETLPDWAEEFDAKSWGQFFLKFILSNEAVTCVIPGTSKASHMEDNAQAGFGKLPTAKHREKMIELFNSI